MYGYVLPLKSKIRQQDYILYRAFYCGMCKTTGALFGQWARYAVTYDTAFMAVLASECLDYPEKIDKCACVGHPFSKTPMIMRNPLLEKLAAINVILAYYKLKDDVTDGKKKARAALKLFSKAYNKAKALAPGADEIVKDGYERLRRCEIANESVPDRVCDCFASLLKDLFCLILGDKAGDAVCSLVYNVGKFVYIADALDDITDDVRSGNYNPFVAAFGNCENRAAFVEKNRRDIEFMFASTINKAIAAFNDMTFTQSYSLLENIIYYGLRDVAEKLLSAERKLPRPKI